MKKIILILSALAVTVAVHAQGTVNFRNRVSGSYDAPFTLDGVRISGANWTAELLMGADASSLAVVSTSGLVTSASGAGYVNKLGVDTGLAAGGTFTAQIRVYDTLTGASYAAATTKGASDTFMVTLGGVGSPPSTPGDLTGLGNNPILVTVIPEPTTIALLALGGIMLLIRRRE
jgi:hypothetical protein